MPDTILFREKTMTDKSCWTNRVKLRRFTEQDLTFMEQLYAVGRVTELAMTPFSDEQKSLFIKQQFTAQLTHYTTHYNSEKFEIIEVDGQMAGRLFIDIWDNEIRIVDIALAPHIQNQGLGGYLLNKVIEQGRTLKKPVTIHVEQNNPAKRLYERLGFKEKSRTNEVYILMERTCC
ncbi:MAG: ribosomal protein S18 acetylase RimI-like enzyme [Gammaproteobacteria bacterium]|jgi:ribosomal protein S18 acetylase RimI-like enzyme|tara:strand:+ start:14819 stop:15346 length:528 start_codon:yes stop_codon:yes gene_type:complete